MILDHLSSEPDRKLSCAKRQFDLTNPCKPENNVHRGNGWKNISAEIFCQGIHQNVEFSLKNR